MPLEMCEIVPGQRYMKALDTDQRNAMLDATSAAPRQRMREVNQLAGQMAQDIKNGMWP
jgi:NifU-like protein involved in Fe-S cluster formation